MNSFRVVVFMICFTLTAGTLSATKTDLAPTPTPKPTAMTPRVERIHARMHVEKLRNYDFLFTVNPANLEEITFRVRKIFLKPTSPHEELVVLLRVPDKKQWKDLIRGPIVHEAWGLIGDSISPKDPVGSCHGFAFRRINAKSKWLGMSGVLQRADLERWAAQKKTIQFVFNQQHSPPVPGLVPDIVKIEVDPAEILLSQPPGKPRVPKK